MVFGFNTGCFEFLNASQNDRNFSTPRLCTVAGILALFHFQSNSKGSRWFAISHDRVPWCFLVRLSWCAGIRKDASKWFGRFVTPLHYGHCCGETCSTMLDDSRSSVRTNSASKNTSGTPRRAETRTNAGPQLRIVESWINSSHLRRKVLLVLKPKKIPRTGFNERRMTWVVIFGLAFFFLGVLFFAGGPPALVSPLVFASERAEGLVA